MNKLYEKHKQKVNSLGFNLLEDNFSVRNATIISPEGHTFQHDLFNFYKNPKCYCEDCTLNWRKESGNQRSKNRFLKDKEYFESLGDFRILSEYFEDYTTKTKIQWYSNKCQDTFYQTVDVMKHSSCYMCYCDKCIRQRQLDMKDKILKQTLNRNKLEVKRLGFELISSVDDLRNQDSRHLILKVKSNKGHIFETTLSQLRKTPTCKCDICRETFRSMYEDEILRFIRTFYSGDILTNTRDILRSKKELDIFLVDKRIAIEFNGNVWHTTTDLGFNEAKSRPRDYHLKKSLDARDSGVVLYHIWEYEYVNNRDKVLQQLKNLITGGIKIHAKSCHVEYISNQEAYQFFEDNHRQGGRYGAVNIALVLNHKKKNVSGGTIVSVMQFSKDNQLTRFASLAGYNVLEGASTLFNKYINDFNVKQCYSYSDIATTTGNVYKLLGFRESNKVYLSYFWTKKDSSQFYERRSCQKKNLSRILKKQVDLSKSEREIMESEGYLQIWDAGKIRWDWAEEQS